MFCLKAKKKSVMKRIALFFFLGDFFCSSPIKWLKPRFLSDVYIRFTYSFYICL
ncbi:hypothetical protein BY458DRAFT_511713 [Sporodiniella umbellata]|nr:hypothetical protein BY458DRAFT_511713 [Sporodiniella umbellata]